MGIFQGGLFCHPSQSVLLYSSLHSQSILSWNSPSFLIAPDTVIPLLMLFSLPVVSSLWIEKSFPYLKMEVESYFLLKPYLIISESLLSMCFYIFLEFLCGAQFILPCTFIYLLIYFKQEKQYGMLVKFILLCYGGAMGVRVPRFKS